MSEKEAEMKPETKPESKHETKPETKSETKPELKPVHEEKGPEVEQVKFITRETSIRYFGYAQEVGCVLSALLPPKVGSSLLTPAWGAFTYSYIFKDVYDKAFYARESVEKATEPPTLYGYIRRILESLHIVPKKPDLEERSKEFNYGKYQVHALDALAWQGITSILFPALLFRKFRPWLECKLCQFGVPYRFATTIPGIALLGLLPFLGKYVDNTVDLIFDHTVRKAFSKYYDDDTRKRVESTPVEQNH